VVLSYPLMYITLNQVSVTAGQRFFLASDFFARSSDRFLSHPILRPNPMLMVCVPKNQVYTHTI
jgi:hypothetical protein